MAPHRGAHYLSVKATELYDQARQKVQEFIKARSRKEIIFTRNTTESINLVAYSYGMNFIEENDEILYQLQNTIAISCPGNRWPGAGGPG